jgi:hypothetical protein
MATFSITITFDGGTTTVTTTSGDGTSSFDPLVVQRSDVLNFSNVGIGVASITGPNTDKFTPTSLNISANGSGTITVLSNATFGSDSFIVTKGGSTDSLWLSVISSDDTTPSAFDIGSPVASAELSTSYSFAQFLVKGITDPTTWTSTNCTVSVNGSAPTSTSGTVNLNDIVYVRGTSSSAYSTSTTQTLVIGGVSNSNTITTKSDPGEGARIVFPIPVGTGNVRLTDLTNFFSAPVGHFSNPPRSMSDFRRGGLHVPDITENSGIANTTQTNDNTLGDFRGSKSTFLFITYPSNKSDAKNTINGAQSAQVSWSATSDWSLGYSPFSKYNAEYRYVLVEDSGIWTGVTFTSVTGTPGTYAAANISFSVQEDAPQNVERDYSGTVTIQARSLIDPSIILTADVRYNLFFYGP